MKKFLKNVITEVANFWGLTPYDVVDVSVKSVIVAISLFAGIRPFFWGALKIGELIGKI